MSELFYRLRKTHLIRIIEKSMLSMMPILMIGAYADVLATSFVSYDSWFINVFNLTYKINEVFEVRTLAFLHAIQFATTGISGLLLAYFIASFTAKKRDGAGITAISVLLMLSFKNNLADNKTMPFKTTVLNYNFILFSLVVGLIVGYIFNRWGTDIADDFEERVWNIFKPIFISFVLAVIIAFAILMFKVKATNAVFDGLIKQLQNANDYVSDLIWYAFAIVLYLIGLPYPIQTLYSSSGSVQEMTNFNYALLHNGSWKVPYRFLGSEIFTSYAGLMGLVALALVITILLFSQFHRRRTIAILSLFPTIFGNPIGLFMGIAVFFNPVWILGILSVSIVNITVVTILIAIKFIPPLAYASLWGMPDILSPFVGTNGNWGALLVTLVLLFVDVLIFKYWLKLDEKILRRVNDEEK
ncbi:MAG: hypothetical protein Q3960_04710 [Lactobacillus sp.]|nr:hypothetical protein [Lactobacillus sp.]